jgi:hypothetical protein
LKRLSVYNPNVHPRFPLSSVRLKNSTGQHLMQGPVAVYDQGGYLGDCRVLDLQPGQERLLSYAMDLGVEVRPGVEESSDDLSKIAVLQGTLALSHQNHRSTTYVMLNRSTTDRNVVVEHANSSWSLAEGEKPVETTRDYHRFAWKVPAGKTQRHTVKETTTVTMALRLSDQAQLTDRGLRYYMAHPRASKAIKEALGKELATRRRLADLRTEISKLTVQYETVTADQQRTRTNLDKAPAGSATQKRFLEKLEKQETQIEKLQGELAEKRAALLTESSEHEAYLKKLNVK